jgi:hypothetical protein
MPVRPEQGGFDLDALGGVLSGLEREDQADAAA